MQRQRLRDDYKRKDTRTLKVTSSVLKGVILINCLSLTEMVTSLMLLTVTSALPGSNLYSATAKWFPKSFQNYLNRENIFGEPSVGVTFSFKRTIISAWCGDTDDSRVLQEKWRCRNAARLWVRLEMTQQRANGEGKRKGEAEVEQRLLEITEGPVRERDMRE